jgi:ribosomal protein S6--L-glutamate ligase
MLRLAVATSAETYERMVEPLAERDIEVEHVQTSERTFDPAERVEGFDVGFVYPPRLAEGGVVDGLLGVPWVNDREAVLRSRHKGETLARLARAGLPVPDTRVVSDPVDTDRLESTFAALEGPVVVKPNSATRGIGVTRAADVDSFLGVCDYLDLVHDYRATGDRSFLVQEFLPDARDYRVMVVDGEYAGAVERERPQEHPTDVPGRADDGTGRWKHNVHLGARAERVELPKELRELAEDVAEALEIRWLGVDLLCTDERVVVNETNARPTIDSAEKYEAGFWDDVARLVRETA